MLIVGLYGALLINAPWMTIAITLLAYSVSIPFGYRAYRRMEGRSAAAAAETASTSTPDSGPNGVTVFPSKPLNQRDRRGPAG
jgi:hypothetical protein